jgi:RecB family exonuclease
LNEFENRSGVGPGFSSPTPLSLLGGKTRSVAIAPEEVVLAHCTHSSDAHSLPVAQSADPASYSRLLRFAQCPLSYKLHYVDALAPELTPEARFGAVLRRTLAEIVREHIAGRRVGPLDRVLAGSHYQLAWIDSDLGAPALFAEGRDIVQRWVAREGVVDSRTVVGVEIEFEVTVGNVLVAGSMDHAERVGEDGVRVRAYKTGRRPLGCRDVEDSLLLGIYDLAARQLWPWAKRVEVGFDLLRHDVVLATERTEAQRESTREYIEATAAQIHAETAFPARLSTACSRCEHRARCSAHAEALARRTLGHAADLEDLTAVSREREELAALVKIAEARKDTLDDVLRDHLDEHPQLVVDGRRYTLTTVTRKDYPLVRTLEALAAAGVAIDQALEQVGRVDPASLRSLLRQLGERLGDDDLECLQAIIEGSAELSLSSRLCVREVHS